MQLKNDTTHLYDRIGKKNRKHVMLSSELLGVLNGVTRSRGVSDFVERAVWKALVDEYGIEAVQTEIASVQAGLDADERLLESQSYRLEV
jgi:hypothetical protein